FPLASAPAPIVATVPEPVLPIPSREAEQDALLSPEEVNDALLQGVLAQPIEEWMSFLHPQQAKLVRRSFKQVLIPDIRREHTVTEPPTEDTERERWDLTRRELYVAMTRARDGLWVGISA
ncbi:MAG: hypothetical protein VB093_06785, partial [Propionicimonas sp.]|nr:hypothetical protein [Propionicimonas sp.]